MKPRRNMIVSLKSEEGYWHPFGRINKILPNNQAEVILCTKDFCKVELDKLNFHNDYKGFWDKRSETDRFVFMSTLRQLKQRSQHYYPEVWKKPNKRVVRYRKERDKNA